MRLCLGLLDANDGLETAFYRTFFYLDPARNRKLSAENLRAEAHKWVLRNAFRNAVEALSPLLEGVRAVLAIWSLKGLIRGEDYHRRMNVEAAKFDRCLLPNKLDFLRDEYDFKIPDDWREIILTIVSARNCLVHRGGIVGDRDAKSGEVLVVKRLRLGTFAKRGDEYRPANEGELITEGEYLVVARHPTEKRFKIGEAVDFDAEEFTEVCYTFLQFGQLLKSLLSKYEREKVMVETDAQRATGIKP